MNKRNLYALLFVILTQAGCAGYYMAPMTATMTPFAVTIHE